MSAFMDLVMRRRSVRSYRPDPVPREMIESCVEAARFAPSSSNTQSWRFFVAEGESKNRLVNEALGGVVVPNRFAADAPVIVAIAMKRDIVTHRLGAGIKGIGYHLLDAGIAGEHFVLRAAELGLGTCWIGWFDAKKAKRILDIPSSWDLPALITVGFAAGEPKPRERRSSSEILTFKGGD